MQNPIKEIYKYNKDRGLLDLGYTNKRECAFPIEEALEGFDNVTLSKLLKPREELLSPKEISREIIKIAAWKGHNDIPEVDQLDKHLDIIVYSLGSIFKLGLNSQEAMNALSIVAQANSAKSELKDEDGKNIKGDKWVDPANALQTLLDKVHARHADTPGE